MHFVLICITTDVLNIVEMCWSELTHITTICRHLQSVKKKLSLNCPYPSYIFVVVGIIFGHWKKGINWLFLLNIDGDRFARCELANPCWQADATLINFLSIDMANNVPEYYPFKFARSNRAAMFELMEDIVDYFMVDIYLFS